MSKQPASIFNDVIGPVMRGPSSSHVAAAVRIGKLGRQMVKGNLEEVIVKFDPNGSLATTYHGHGSDMGLVGGLLDYDPQDPRLPKALELVKEKGLGVSFHVVDYEADHPNTYKMTLISDKGERIETTSISTGGGMIQYEEIEGFKVNIAGDFYESLIFIEDTQYAEKIIEQIKMSDYEIDYCDQISKEGKALINIKGSKALDEKIVKEIKNNSGVVNVMCLSPVLPIMSRKNCEVPFINAEEMLKVAEKENLKLWELATLYESHRGSISKEEVFEKMRQIVMLMDGSIESGLKGTSYEDRILGPQAHLIEKKQREGKLIPGNVLNKVISFITAMMEVKSAMGVIVAAPTAGSCGGLPGTTKELGLTIEDATKGMLAAGMIGLFIADRVEVPCLGKNVMAGSNAIACANMVLAGYDKVIPLDETIESMYKVGKMLPSALRCTGYGGLSITKTA
ncbi:MAG: L-serine ammonia-lyase, iron-sulfur-dependent, subunit alpha [Marinisporobacter sp.]|jgi:L-serine dehydratase|nr:L-serine ammonia-lyase, iron-sulfur-dependent, subunit alpha [Marinisporobacter sp.]